eukprot:g44579.t1
MGAAGPGTLCGHNVSLVFNSLVIRLDFQSAEVGVVGMGKYWKPAHLQLIKQGHPSSDDESLLVAVGLEPGAPGCGASTGPSMGPSIGGSIGKMGPVMRDGTRGVLADPIANCSDHIYSKCWLLKELRLRVDELESELQ